MTNVITSYLPSPRCIWSVLLGNFSCLSISGLMLIFRSSRYDDKFFESEPLNVDTDQSSPLSSCEMETSSAQSSHLALRYLNTLSDTARVLAGGHNDQQQHRHLHQVVDVIINCCTPSHCSLYCKKNIFIELISSILQR